MFVDALDVDDVIAHLLVAEGFTSLEDIAFVPLEELVAIEGFNEEVAEELKNRAQAYLDRKDEEYQEKRRTLGVEDDLAALSGLTPSMLVKLGEAGVKTLDDLGDLAADELLEILADTTLGGEQANDIIMAARAHWFAEDAAPEPAGTKEA